MAETRLTNPSRGNEREGFVKPRSAIFRLRRYDDIGGEVHPGTGANDVP